MNLQDLAEVKSFIEQCRIATRFLRISRNLADVNGITKTAYQSDSILLEKSIDLNEVSSLFYQFHEVGFPQRFRKIDEGYDDVLATYRRTAAGFNIFRVLGVHRREVKTHSAFIRELLNPYGSHRHGFLFLKEFLSLCCSLDQVVSETEAEDCELVTQDFPDISHEDLGAYKWLVSREYHTGEQGRLDILIRCEALEFLCVIENKIYAAEGRDQLQSYWEWMSVEERRKVYPKQALIFLTPHGRESYFPNCLAYFPMSYKKHIARWLTATLPEIEAPSLRSIIEQYIRAVDLLMEEI